jgi:hypothetical protein
VGVANPGTRVSQPPARTARVRPGSTPPDSAQTSGLSEHEPRTSWSFPPTGIATMVVIGVIVVVFATIAILLVLDIAGVFD